MAEVTNDEGIEILKKVSELFTPILKDKDDFIPYIPQLHELIKGKPELHVTMYDGIYDYDCNGKEKYKGGERITYRPITIHISPADGPWFYVYDNGNWDIEDDIKKLVWDNTEFREYKFNIYVNYSDDPDDYGLAEDTLCVIAKTEDEAEERAYQILEEEEKYDYYGNDFNHVFLKYTRAYHPEDVADIYEGKDYAYNVA